MLDHLVNGQAPRRVLDQHRAKKVLALLAQVVSPWVSFQAKVLVAYFPFLDCRGLLFLLEGMLREKEAMQQAAQAPHIDTIRVKLAQDYLRCNVALGTDPPRKGIGRRFKLGGAAEVRNAGRSLCAFIGHQYVLQLDVAMNNSEMMQILNSFSNLKDDLADPCLAQGEHTKLHNVVV